MGTLDTFPFDEIVARGSIREADVLLFRQAGYEDGFISREEAECLIELNASCPIQDPAWNDVFQEALTDHLVNQAEPAGYVTAENADWLIEKIAPQGRVNSRKDLDLIIHIIDTARWSPERLVAFAIRQVRDAICSGEGALRQMDQPAGTIDDADVELIRSMIYAFGGDGNVSISKSEAEMLCDINDALDPEQINASWTELYVKAMANFLLGNSGYRVPTREQALRSEAWLDDTNGLSPLDIVRSITKVSLDDLKDVYTRGSREECTLERLDREYREMLTGEEVTGGEAEWMAARLARDGKISATETALIEYLKENSLNLDHRLDDIIQKHLDAA